MLKRSVAVSNLNEEVEQAQVEKNPIIGKHLLYTYDYV